MHHCPNFRRTLQRHTEKHLEVAIARCKSWLCPYCRDINAKRLRHAIMAQIPELGVTLAMFGTITAGRHARTASNTYNALHRAWPMLRQWILRHYGPFEYLAIYERHKSGAYHLHWVALWRYTPYHPKLHARLKRQIKDNAALWRIGYMADVQPIRGEVDGVVKYISKSLATYLSKGTQSAKDGLPKNARLYYLSRGIKSSVEESDGENSWQIAGLVHIDTLTEYRVFSVSEGRYLSFDDFETSDVWPQHVDNVDS